MGATQVQLREMQVIGRTTREWIIHARECPPLIELGIQYAGITVAGEGFAFCRLAPAIAVVFGSLAGEGRVLLNGRWEKCGAGDVYLTPAGTPHAYRAVRGRKWRLCWVAYEEPGNRQSVVHGEEPRLRKEVAQVLANAIMGLYGETHALNEPAVLHHWADLIDVSARRLIHERHIDERLLTLWSSVDTELGRPWTLDAIAARVHLSSEQLRHLCQKHFGRSPMEHLTYLRMKRAAVLLVRTNQKISVVAQDVGYENAFAFSTAFKRVIGVSPSEFVRLHG